MTPLPQTRIQPGAWNLVDAIKAEKVLASWEENKQVKPLWGEAGKMEIFVVEKTNEMQNPLSIGNSNSLFLNCVFYTYKLLDCTSINLSYLWQMHLSTEMKEEVAVTALIQLMATI